mmetsp:Transcript_34218/g.39072  ORF Transcript_34218/g.39072 Transcript_34218/m.39072 type:complete len:90 (-) Transcript_34218:43-312(-)
MKEFDKGESSLKKKQIPFLSSSSFSIFLSKLSIFITRQSWANNKQTVSSHESRGDAKYLLLLLESQATVLLLLIYIYIYMFSRSKLLNL